MQNSRGSKAKKIELSALGTMLPVLDLQSAICSLCSLRVQRWHRDGGGGRVHPRFFTAAHQAGAALHRWATPSVGGGSWSVWLAQRLCAEARGLSEGPAGRCARRC